MEKCAESVLIVGYTMNRECLADGRVGGRLGEGELDEVGWVRVWSFLVEMQKIFRINKRKVQM